MLAGLNPEVDSGTFNSLSIYRVFIRQSSIDAVSFSLMSIGARKNICFSVYLLPENDLADHSTQIKRNTFFFHCSSILQMYHPLSPCWRGNLIH